jgi:uncharacterized membrane protein YfcA
LGLKLILVLAVIFFATLVRSAFGFGEALIAVPLLALVLPVEVAAPLAVLVSVTVAALILAQDWRKVHVRSAASLVLATFAGIPLGLLLLKSVPEHAVKTLLAVTIIGFAVFCLAGRRHMQLHLADDRLSWVFGFFAGVMGGAYGMNGPPLVVYGTLRRWSAEHFRATLQGYFLPASLVGLVGYWVAGFWKPDVTHLYVASLAPVVVAVLLGRWLNLRMSGPSFVRYVHAALVVIGFLLLVQTWSS